IHFRGNEIDSSSSSSLLSEPYFLPSAAVLRLQPMSRSIAAPDPTLRFLWVATLQPCTQLVHQSVLVPYALSAGPSSASVPPAPMIPPNHRVPLLSCPSVNVYRCCCDVGH
ncbi:hypothetical protein AKJ16_DCAP17514, partial [Drosera capensis]